MFGRCRQYLLQEAVDPLAAVARGMARPLQARCPNSLLLYTRTQRPLSTTTVTKLSRSAVSFNQGFQITISIPATLAQPQTQTSRNISQQPNTSQRPRNLTETDHKELQRKLPGIQQGGYRRVHASPAFVEESENEGLQDFPEFYNGPDQILPSRSNKCWNLNDSVELQITETGLSSKTPYSVYSLLERSSVEHANTKAMAVKRDGEWKYHTYQQSFEESCTVARAFIKLGLERMHGVCIMGFNSPEWFMSNFGAIFAGGLSVGIYVNNSASACVHMAQDSKAQVFVADTEETVNKIMSIKDQLPHLKVIVQYLGQPTVPEVLSWKELLEIGDRETNNELTHRLRQQAVNQCCSLVYTSGTTGNPKAVMCSQDNLTWCGKNYSKYIDMVCGQTMVSYLPLNHIAGQMADIYCATSSGHCIYFADPDALKGSLAITLKEVQPTIFLTVPRFLERIYEKINSQIEAAGFAKKSVVTWARSQALNYHKATIDGRDLTQFEMYNYKLAKSLVLDNVKRAIGFSNIKRFACGTAPISNELFNFFLSFDCPIINAFGLSETQAVGTMGNIAKNSYREGSLGKPMESIEFQIQERSLQMGDHMPGVGEICFRGRNVFMGYLNCEDKTHETIRDNGWMLSGDIGCFDNDGFLYLTGRAKEIIITAGGENIAPIPIEAAIKKELPIASTVMLHGDKRKYLSLLITLHCEVDPGTGLPTDILMPRVIDWLRKCGSSSTTLAQLLQEIKTNPTGAVIAEIQQAIDRYNVCAISPVHQVRRWAVLPREFSFQTGELSNTLKLKKSEVARLYADVIESLYE